MSRRIEHLFAGAALFLASSALFPLLLGAGGSTLVEAPKDSRLTAASLAVYGIALVQLVRRRVALAALVAGNRLLFALVGLAFLSALWSVSPGTTLAKAVALGLTTVLGVYLAVSFTPSDLARVLSWVLAVLVVLSAAVALKRPDLGLDHLRGDTWRGVFTTKNELGRIAVLAAVVWFVRAITRSARLTVALPLTGLSVLALQRSGSKTGLLVLALAAVFLVALPALRAHSSIALPAGIALAIVGLVGADWLVGHSDAAVSTVGADSTLTGRSGIWSAVWAQIHVHPLSGFGFGAFWTGINGPAGEVWARIGATPPHAHNGVLDLWLDLGLLGVVLFLGSFVLVARRAVRLLRDSWSIEGVLPLAYLFFFALYNVSESSLLKQHSLFWILYTVAAVQLARPEAQTARAEDTLPLPSFGLTGETA